VVQDGRGRHFTSTIPSRRAAYGRDTIGTQAVVGHDTLTRTDAPTLTYVGGLAQSSAAVIHAIACSKSLGERFDSGRAVDLPLSREFSPLCFMPSGSDIYKFNSQTGDLSGQCEKMGRDQGVAVVQVECRGFS
jgi:hypothetical protein